MAYIVNKTDGTAVTTITDGTIDNTTSLTLFGKSYSGFGELLNEDLVKLLENSLIISSTNLMTTFKCLTLRLSIKHFSFSRQNYLNAGTGSSHLF